MATLATSITGIAPENISSGVNIIELEHDRHVPELQLALANDPNIEYVSRVAVRYLTVQPKSSKSGAGIAAAAPPNPSLMWNLAKIQWQAAFALTNFANADNIRVAVLDTGIDVNHPDLKGRVKSYVYAHPDLPAISSDRDIIGHGTHVAGTITAAIDNGLGINGICDCELNIWKIFDDRPDFVSCTQGYAYYVDPVMTPYVTGAVALLIANRGERMSPADIKNQLMQTADKVPGMGGNDFTADFGAGRLNLVRLLSE